MRADLKSKITVSGPTHGVARLAVDGDSAKPLVSCLMVTRDRPVQARLAIQCFLEQTYGNRELVIVDDSATDDLSAVVAIHPQIRILRPDGSQPNLGRARNRAVAEARGEFVCQWDDDDLYDPRRLETQLAALQRTGAAACLLSRWIIWWPRASRLAISRRRRWEGSLLSARGALTAYPEYSRGEDTPVIDALIRSTRVVHLDEPQLYIYVVHGQNTFEPGHFAAYWEHADVQYSGERYRAVLGQIAQRAPVAAYARGLALPVESAPTQAVSPEATAAEDVAAAERLLRADRHEEAAAAFEALRRTYPDQPWGACGIARVKARMKDWVTAVDLFLDVRTQFPNYLFGLLCLGQGLNTLGRFAEAEAAFDAARQIRPDLVEPEIGLGESAAMAYDWPLARRRWTEILNRWPANRRAIVGLIETLCRVSQFQAAETKLLSSRALLSEEQQVVERAKLLRRMCRFKDVAQLLDEHPALARRNLDLAILHHEIRSSVSRVSDAQEALSAQIGGPPDEIDSDEGLGSMFAANGLAGADFAFDRLKTVWSTFGLKGVGVGLFPLLIRAIESIDGRDGTTSVLSEVDALPLVDTRAITLHLLAGFERLRLDGGETGAMLRSVALRCDRRAPFGHWREAIEQIADTDDRIRAFFPECAIDSARDQAAARRVVDRILLAVRARSPLSMIRLGDGEGNFLDYPSDQSDHTASDRSAVQRIWWDEPRLTSETCEPLRQEFLAAIRHADIVGVPEAWRLCRELPLPCPRDLYATTNQLRGLLCVRHHLTRAMELDPVAPLFSRRQLLTSCHISSDLSAFDLYDLLFAEIGSAVVVTCHATLANRLNEKFGLNVDRGYLIPPERKCSAQFEYHNAEQHFPDTFDVLRRTLMPTRDGEVFIVAAGFLGKIYCKWIRERGGIALDVGSMADYWCGFNTRSMAFRKMHFL